MPMSINEVKELIGDLMISIKELQRELAGEKMKVEELSKRPAEIVEGKEHP